MPLAPAVMQPHRGLARDWAAPILQRPFEVRDGHLNIPDLPGIGLEWDEDAIESHRVDR